MCRCPASSSTLAFALHAGRHVLAARGSRTMPVWGEDLTRLEIGDPNAERSTRIILGRLADYVWLLQKPTPAE